MLRRDLSMALLGATSAAALAPRTANAQVTCTAPCYPQTALEAQSPAVMPTNTAYPADAVIDVRRYGFSQSSSATTNASAIATAILVATRFQSPRAIQGGAIVQLPAGSFDVNPFEIPQYVTIRGAGSLATMLTCAASDYFIKMGGSKSGVRKYGCVVSDLGIQMTALDGHGIRLMETVGACVQRVYLEGAIISGRASRGITIDGGDIASFFNHFEDVIANHWQTSYLMQSSGVEKTTLNHFTNCTAFGDLSSVGAASIGLKVTIDQGSGSVWVGGNLESCGRGVQLESGCKSMTLHGARFEGNTKDVQLQATTGASSFIGCFLDMVNGIQNDSSAGYDMHSFIGCVNGSSQDIGSRLMGENRLVAGRIGDRALIVEAYPGHTTQVALQVQNSASTKLFAVNALGEVDKQAYRSGSATPVGSITPRFVGEEYLQTSGTVRWYKSTGVTSSAWVALN